MFVWGEEPLLEALERRVIVRHSQRQRAVSDEPRGAVDLRDGARRQPWRRQAEGPAEADEAESDEWREGDDRDTHDACEREEGRRHHRLELGERYEECTLR